MLTINPSGHARLGTIGIPWRITKIKIVDDSDVLQSIGSAGELCAQPASDERLLAATTKRKTIINGWLHTGDIAIVDADGYPIVDRKRT